MIEQGLYERRRGISSKAVKQSLSHLLSVVRRRRCYTPLSRTLHGARREPLWCIHTRWDGMGWARDNYC